MNRGFTLLEILLSLSIIAILAGLSVPVYQSLQTDNELDLATMTAAQSLRRAQLLSRGMKNDSSWGVHMATSTITLFSGADYMNRDTQYDEVFEYSELISFSGDQEFIFEKLTGDSATGTLTVSTQGGELVDVVVNQYGRVNY